MSPFVERLIAGLHGVIASAPELSDGRRRAAVAVLIYDGTPDPHVLLMQRALRASDPWSGHISLPGGGYDLCDGTLLATAIRETREELGIDLTIARFVGVLPVLAPLVSGPSGIEVTPFVFATEARVETVCGPEAVAAFWLPIEAAATGDFDGIYTYPGTERTFPSWNFAGHTIWGLTRRILGDLIAVAGISSRESSAATRS